MAPAPRPPPGAAAGEPRCALGAHLAQRPGRTARFPGLSPPHRKRPGKRGGAAGNAPGSGEEGGAGSGAVPGRGDRLTPSTPAPGTERCGLSVKGPAGRTRPPHAPPELSVQGSLAPLQSAPLRPRPRPWPLQPLGAWEGRAQRGRGRGSGLGQQGAGAGARARARRKQTKQWIRAQLLKGAPLISLWGPQWTSPSNAGSQGVSRLPGKLWGGVSPWGHGKGAGRRQGREHALPG